MMTLDYTEKGKLKIDMRKYLSAQISDLPHKLSYKVKFPWTKKMLKVDEEEKKFGDEKSTIFHQFVNKGMFLTKLGCAGVHPAIYFLGFRVKEPTNQYCMKLLRFLSYIKCTIDDVLTLEADNKQTLYWQVH